MVLAILLPVFASAQRAREKTEALTKARTIGESLLIYMGDSEKFPPIESGEQVTPLIAPFFGKTNSLLLERPKQEALVAASRAYDWNRLLSKMNLEDIAAPDATWVFKSSTDTKYHLRVAGFADGRARWTNEFSIARLNADPKKQPPTIP